MAVKWFEDPDYKERMTLPWLKDYLKKFKGDTQEREVVGLICTENGILVVTNQWKAFIFKREKRHDQLLEALEVWKVSPEPVARLIAKPVKGEKFQLGIDDEFVDWYWEEVEEGKFSVMSQDGCTPSGSGQETEDTDTNPFLPGTAPSVRSTQKNKSKPAPKRQPAGSTIA